MKKFSMMVLAIATIAMVGCKKEEVQEYAKNLDGYWASANSEVTMEVSGTQAIVTADGVAEEGVLTYNASTGVGSVTFAEATYASASIQAKAGDVRTIHCTLKNGDTSVFDGDLTKTVKPDDNNEGNDIPDLDKPASGVRFVIQIPVGTECHGIAFKGSYDGTAWSGADTYCGAGQNAAAGPDECITFVPVEGYEGWFTADYELGTTVEIGLQGKICLIFAGDESWQGQATDWAYDENWTSASVMTSDDGNIQVLGEGLVYVTIGGWQMSECVEASQYTVSVKVPTCGDYDVEIIGSFDNWAGTAMIPNEDRTVWTATIDAQAGAEYKFRQAGTWDNEIQQFVATETAPEGEWTGFANFKFGAETTIEHDFSDPEKYKWTLCE